MMSSSVRASRRARSSAENWNGSSSARLLRIVGIGLALLRLVRSEPIDGPHQPIEVVTVQETVRVRGNVVDHLHIGLVAPKLVAQPLKSFAFRTNGLHIRKNLGHLAQGLPQGFHPKPRLV